VSVGYARFDVESFQMMQQSLQPFVVGGTYADRRGEYTVISLEGNRVELEYKDGTRSVGDIGIKVRIHQNILLEQNARHPVQVPRSSNTRDRGEHYFFHADVFPIIAEIIESHSESSTDYVTHDRIVDAMLEHPKARLFLDSCPNDKPREWWALDMVAFFSKVYTEGRSPWQSRFKRTEIDKKYAYKVADRE
jgi:hypothetical protein